MLGHKLNKISLRIVFNFLLFKRLKPLQVWKHSGELPGRFLYESWRYRTKWKSKVSKLRCFSPSPLINNTNTCLQFRSHSSPEEMSVGSWAHRKGDAGEEQEEI